MNPLQKLATIADAYDKNALDEARPEWGNNASDFSQIVLFSGRGGKELLTLQDCFDAKDLWKMQLALQKIYKKEVAEFEKI